MEGGKGMSEIFDIYEKAPKADELLKAFDNGTIPNVKFDDPKSAIIDPYGIATLGGLRQKPTTVPYATLRNMAKVPAIAAVINTRLNQVARFARRPRFEGDMGFKIVLKKRDDKMSDAQKQKAFEIEEFILRTGAVKNAKRKDNFDSFLRKIVRDTLTIDAMVWEHVPNLKGGLAEIWAVDAATIELVANAPVGEAAEIPVYEPMTKRGFKDTGHIAYVQRVDGQIIAEYTEDELCYAIRNPRTDIYTVDFGMSELETLMEIVTGIMNGIRYNTSYFSESHLPQGVLSIIGNYKDEHLEAFKRHWKTLTSGAAGKWAVPVMVTKDGQGFNFTPFKTSNRDMEFNEFLEFLFNITCAVYQIDPNEVGFKSWTSSNSMSASDNTEVKIDSSKDKGFIPLMQFLANTFNSEVIDRIDDEFALEWVGLDEEDADKKLERDKMNLEMGKITVAEIRKRDDMEEILDEEGKPAKWTLAPANSTLIQVYMADIQAEQQQAQMAQQQQMGAQQTAQQGIDADADHKRKLEIMDKQHAQNLEVKKLDQAHQMNMSNRESFNGAIDKENDHLKNLEVMDKQHSQATEDSGVAHKRGLETKKIDQEHAMRMEKEKQKAKAGAGQNIKKSLDTSEDMDIVITWDEY